MTPRLPPEVSLLEGLELAACLADRGRSSLPVRWGNDAFRALAGQAAVGRPLADLLGDGGDAVIAAAREGSRVKIEGRLRHGDGGDGQVEVALTYADDVHDGPGWAVLVLVDVADRARALSEAKVLERRYRALIETVPAVTYVSDWSAEAALRYVSPQIEELLGYPPKQWIHGRGMWQTHLHPEDRDRVLAAQQKAFEAEEPLDIEYRMNTRTGEIRWIWEREAIVRDESGRPRYSQGVLVDLTEKQDGAGDAASGCRRWPSRLRSQRSHTHERSAVWWVTVVHSLADADQPSTRPGHAGSRP